MKKIKKIVVIAIIIGLSTITAYRMYNHYFGVYYRYYTDYVDPWGYPKGLYKLSDRQKEKMSGYYCFEWRKGLLYSITYMNSKGETLDHDDTEYRDRVARQIFGYIDEGGWRLNKINLFNSRDSLLYKVWCHVKHHDFNDSDDDTQCLPDSQTDITQSLFSAKPGHLISRYTFQRDKEGYIQKIEFKLNTTTTQAADMDSICAFKYERNKLGQVTSLYYLGANDSCRTNKFGVAGRHYVYDSRGHMQQVDYFGKNGKAIMNRLGWATRYRTFDRNGNLQNEYFLDTLGNPIKIQ